MKTIIAIFTMIVVSANHESITPTATYTYTSKTCSYDVYFAKGGGTIRCNDWTFKNRVSPGRSVSITLKPGDNTIVRVLHEDYDVCTGGKIKREDNLSMNNSATRSSSISWELHDWDCP